MSLYIDNILAFGYHDPTAPKGLDAWAPADTYYARFVDVLPAWISAVSALSLSGFAADRRASMLATIEPFKHDGRAIAEQLNIAVQLRDSGWDAFRPVHPEDRAEIEADFEAIELATAGVLHAAGLL